MSEKVKFTVLLLFGTSFFVSAQVGFKLSTDDPVISPATVVEMEVDTGKYGEVELPIYRTMTITEWERVNTKIGILRRQANTLQADLDSNSVDPAHLYTDAEFNTKKNTVDSLRALITKLEAKKDTLYYKYVREYVDYKRVTAFPGPLRARAVFDEVYGNEGKQFKAMGNAGVQFGTSGTTSIYSEIVSGNMGMVRVGFGTMLTSDDSENDSTSQTEQAYQRLISNGGNTILSLEYPMFYGSWLKNQSNGIIRTIVKGSADFPAFGTSTDKWAGSLMIGLDSYFDIATDNNQIRFFANASSFYVRGTDIFQSNLSVASPDFSFGQLTAGIVFMENFKLSFIICTWSSQAILEKKGVAIGGQVLR